MTRTSAPVLINAILRVGLRFLPPADRHRYAEEVAADIATLPPRQALGYAVSFLLGAPALRRALRAGRPPGAPSACRIGLHRNRVFRPNPENHQIIALECRACGRIKDPKQYDHRGSDDSAGYASVYYSGGM